MESLLSVAFDNVASTEALRIRKGLRQIEGLFAQICLLTKPSLSLSPHKRRSSNVDAKEPSRRLQDLTTDPAFKEFFRIQDSFRWNIASRLISTLERLLGMGNTSQTDLIILSALNVLQGALLLHPPSRSLFTRETCINLLLDLLDAANPPKIQSHALLVLMTALLDTPRNTRIFEEVDGLLCVASLFKDRSSTKEVRMRSLEFLYFYLMPETPALPVSAPNTAVLERASSKQLEPTPRHRHTYSEDSGGGMEGDQADDTRSVAAKQALLGRHLSKVADLVADLRTNAPFGLLASEG